MKKIYIFFLSFSITTLPFSATSKNIYKSVDESGTAIFSNKKTPDAEKIMVQPNVVDVEIPDMPPTTPRKTNQPAVMQTTHNNSGKSQAIEMGNRTATAGNLKRRIRNHTSGEGINRPVTRPTVRAGGHR